MATAHRAATPYVMAGALAAALGAATGHLVAALVEPAASPVTAVAGAVIDLSPTPVKVWAVRAFGAADRLVLLGSVVLGTLVLSALAGRLSMRWRPAGAVLLGALSAVAMVAAGRATGSALSTALVPGLLTGVVGVLTLLVLARLADRAAGAPESPLDHSAQAPGHPTRSARRVFLLGAGGAGAASLVLGGSGQAVAGRRAAVAAPLPPPAEGLTALPRGLEQRVPGLSPLRTPVADFFRVDTALLIPRLDPRDWTLRVDGRVRRPLTVTYAELLAMGLVERDITITCVSNEVGGPYVGSTRWTGVPVRIILERAGIHDDVDQILSTSADGMTISTPVAALTDDRDALLVVGMDGAPLPPRHGFPVRLVTPGLYGFVGSTKWLTRLTATTYAEEQAYWTKRGWATDAPVRTQARIDTPSPSRAPSAGRIAIGGVAWSQARDGITGVQVRVDDGPWQSATLGPQVAAAYWRQWFLPWEATPGRHRLTVRATDGTGTPQTEQQAPGFPSGATGLHSVEVDVA